VPPLRGITNTTTPKEKEGGEKEKEELAARAARATGV
jgi:hypothetical protein